MPILITDRQLTLNGVGDNITSPAIDLPANQDMIRFRIRRPTTGGQVVWDDLTRIGVQIQVLMDGEIYQASFRGKGGILSDGKFGGEVESFIGTWYLQTGNLDGTKINKRLGQIAQDPTTYKMRMRIQLLEGTQIDTRLQVQGTNSDAPARVL